MLGVKEHGRGVFSRASGLGMRHARLLSELLAEEVLNTTGLFAKYPLSPGYAAAGEVVAVAPDVSDLREGDRLARRGHHAQFAKLPAGACVRVPDEVADEDAVFFMLIRIAMASLRIDPYYGIHRKGVRLIGTRGFAVREDVQVRTGS